jgi:hypothetical protein
VSHFRVIFLKLFQVHSYLYSSVRAKLRDCNLDEGFDFAKNYFVRCFYVGYEGDPENVEKGFLRSTLLVQVCF